MSMFDDSSIDKTPKGRISSPSREGGNPGVSERKETIILKDRVTEKRRNHRKGPAILVAVDFSHCSRLALSRAKSWAESQGGNILVLHVIDESFVDHCIHQRLGTRGEVKKKLFLNAKRRLREFLRSEGMDGDNTQMLICEGTPFIEINKKAVENDIEMIIMGSKGHSDDMRAIFFGSTTERVLRFIKRPVLCIPPEGEYRLK
jgi:nucleotide-binding universal stress UspA family protein